MQVLVVEDECLIRMLVCDLLEEAGCVCIEAGNGIEALALLDSKLCRPALLVTDFNLGPGPNGQTLAREAVSRIPGLPVVFMTGNPESFEGYAFRNDERLIAKPFSGSHLVERMAELMPPVPRHPPGLHPQWSTGRSPAPAHDLQVA
ncbi:response regulator [Dankookia rubra]|uniref:Response regulator n=1 Tax=Dankookia rubra TaxID=1442381 RepID=A0A4R5Q6M1_9PROT|nr:response regulator [Dankookia rubra]TDH58193.1 response regulator [Dankookia rubra]